MKGHRIEIRPLHSLEWFMDIGCWIGMAFLQCFRWEAIQRTHPWNNHHLNEHDVSHLDRSMMVKHHGDPRARRAWLFGFIPVFHFACFGGWKGYLVIAPRDRTNEEWYPGWIASGHAIGVSRLPLTGSVKLLIGPGACQFFGITANGTQIALRVVGRGRLGKGGPWRWIPLR
jgi:hypothetical protein